MSYCAACPAALLERNVLSLNRQDVRCRISGLPRDAEGSPCAANTETGTGGHYAGVGGQRCGIWAGEKERLWRNRRAARARMMITADSDWVAA